MGILSKINSETVTARRQFLNIQRKMSEQSVVEESVRAVGLTKEQFLYLRAEQMFTYKDETLSIPSAETVEFTVQVMPYNVSTFLSLRVRGNITVPELMAVIFAEGRKACAAGAARPKQFSIVDDVFKYDPSECVLKVMGRNEYVIPCNEYNQAVRLDSYEYVRNMFTSKESLSFILCLRSELHKVPQSSVAQQADQYAEQLVTTLLTRDVWREREHVTDFILFSTLRFSMNLHAASFIPIPAGETARGVYVSAALYHGGVELASPTLSPIVLCSGNGGSQVVGDGTGAGESVVSNGMAVWNCKLEFGVSGKRMPREARVCLTVYSCDSSLVGQTLAAVNEKHTPVGWYDFLLFDYMDLLRTGTFGVFLWPGKANPIGTCMSNESASGDVKNPFLKFSIDKREKPVKFVPFVPSSDALAAAAMEVSKEKKPMEIETLGIFKGALDVDMLTPLKPEQARVLWEYREFVQRDKAPCLPNLLRAVDWTITDMVYQTHKMLDEWKLLAPLNALKLLDSKFADAHVRRFAVRCLDQMTDAECSQFLLQLMLLNVMVFFLRCISVYLDNRSVMRYLVK